MEQVSTNVDQTSFVITVETDFHQEAIYTTYGPFASEKDADEFVPEVGDYFQEPMDGGYKDCYVLNSQSVQKSPLHYFLDQYQRWLEGWEEEDENGVERIRNLITKYGGDLEKLDKEDEAESA